MKSLSQNKRLLLSLMLLITTFQANAQVKEKIEPETAASKPWPVSKYSAKLGAFWAISNTDIGAGTDKNPYSFIDYENDLGMDRHTASILVNLNARFGKRNRVDLSYYNINRKASKTIDREIHFGEHDYPIHTDINSYLRTNIFRLSYGYAFVSNARWEAGAMIGFHVMAFNVGLDAVGETQQLSLEDDVKFTVPLPDLGMWGIFAFHQKWAVNAELGYFYVNLPDLYLDGRILSGNIAIQYRIDKHWQLDAGYTVFGVKAELDREHLKADFKWNYSGPSISAAYRFGH